MTLSPASQVVSICFPFICTIYSSLLPQSPGGSLLWHQALPGQTEQWNRTHLKEPSSGVTPAAVTPLLYVFPEPCTLWTQITQTPPASPGPSTVPEHKEHGFGGTSERFPNLASLPSSPESALDFNMNLIDSQRGR